MTKYEMLADKINVAQAAMRKALEHDYPIGVKVDFYIMHGQINPSSGEVIAHIGGPYALLRVRQNTTKGNVRDVSVSNLV